MLPRRNSTPTEAGPSIPLEEFARRQAFVLHRLERHGYPCEVQAARRMLRRTQKLLAQKQRHGFTPR